MSEPKKKYRVIGKKFYAGEKGKVVTLAANVGDPFVIYGKLEPYKKPAKADPKAEAKED